MRGQRALVIGCVALFFGCGGTQPPAESPEPTVDEPTTEEPSAETKQPEEKSEAAEGEPKAEGEGEAKAGSEPAFTDGMSVDEAINAVPQGIERMNLDPEVLGKPLMNPDLYKPCKLAPNQHLKIRVAIWEGRAVGIDVIPTPKNEKAASCVKEQIKALTWKDKIKSLNTVDYAL